jgi:AcrR family transcriptional regulator
MTPRLSRAEQGEQTRAELLAAARAEFLGAGYHGATLDRIAAAAGYTKGAVYSRYASKADLFLDLLQVRIDARAADNERRADALVGVDGLTELLAHWRATDREDEAWTLLVMEFRIHAARDPALNARYAALHERTVAGVARTLERVLGAAADPGVARMVLAIGTGTTLEHVTGPDRLSEEKVARVVAALVDETTERS